MFRQAKLAVTATLMGVAAGLAAHGAAAGSATYRNPIIYADYSDPDVLRAGKRYYLVSSSFHFSPGIPVLESPDLVHWRIVSHVLPRLDFAPGYNMVPPFTLTDATARPIGEGQRYGGGVWAPALRYHDHRFYVYWPTPDEGIFVSTATRMEGPWSAPVTVLAGPGYEDPCPFWDTDGSAYLVHAKVGAGALILHRLSPDGMRVLDAGKTIVEDRVNLPVLEGPKLYKRHGWYYIFAPIGGVGSGGQAVLRSRSIDGPYAWRVVLVPGQTQILGPHQGAYVETPTHQGWFVHFNSTGAFGRITYLEPVRWRDDWPVIGDSIGDQTQGQPVVQHALPITEPRAGRQANPYHLQEADEFNSPTLGLQWQWNHNPDDDLWSLSARPGYLRLEAAPAQYLVTARNTLTQMLQGPAMTATTRLEIGHLGEQQRAGLVLFGVRPTWIGVVREAGSTYLTYASAGIETRGPSLSGDAIILRAQVSTDQSVRFAYAMSGETPFAWFGPTTALSKFSWWKGSRPGLFTFIKALPQSTVAPAAAHYVDFDWFHVEH
ncbi:MAG TPA: glycoside hydrolase 43 family protein [Steroidobacteraceae bacterium]|nr:glycoside hydrolase 43 family protein [Steroidobacteraceae bacterium]